MVQDDLVIDTLVMRYILRDMFPTSEQLRLVGFNEYIERKRDENSSAKPFAAVNPISLKTFNIGSETSAFKPHTRESTATTMSPHGSPRKSPVTLKGKTPSPSLLTNDPSEARSNSPVAPASTHSSINPSAQPIQIFNHIHAPPPYTLPMDYSAFRFTHPYHLNFGTSPRSFYPLPSFGYGPFLNPYMHPYFSDLSKTLPAASSSKSDNPSTSARPHPEDSLQFTSQANPYKFPLPSEKAGEPLDLIPRSLYLSKSRKGHFCIYCGKLYSRKYGLKIHLRTHTGYKPLKCKVCLRPFGDPSNLNKHIRLHAEGDTPYRCEYCGKVLVRRRDLERHIKSRHPNEAERMDTSNELNTEHDVLSASEIDNVDDNSDDERDIDIEED